MEAGSALNSSVTVRLQVAKVKKVEDFKYFGSTECWKEVKKHFQAGKHVEEGYRCDLWQKNVTKNDILSESSHIFGLETVALKKRQEAEL